MATKPPLKKPMTAAEEEAAFYEEIGRTTIAWSGVEIALCALFGRIITPADPRGIVAMCAVDAFRPRIGMITDVIQFRSGAETKYKTTWGGIAKRLTTRQSKRSRIVHGNAVTDGKADSGKRIYLVPPLFSPLTHISLDDGSVQPMYIKDIKAARDEFSAVMHETLAFMETLPKPVRLRQ